jgi:hypothetical protein
VMNFYFAPEFYIGRDDTELSGHLTMKGVKSPLKLPYYGAAARAVRAPSSASVYSSDW